MTVFHKYLCIDPSFFIKKKRLEKLPNILNKLGNDDSTIVLPTFCGFLINSNEKNSNDDEISDIKNFKILQKFDSSLKDINEFFQITKKARNLFKNFHVTTADKMTFGLENNNFFTKHLNEISKFGKHIVTTVTEFMIITSKMQGTIVAYGKKFISLIRKIRIASLEGYSNYKHKMIDDGFAPKTLRLISILSTHHDFSAFIQAFDITGIPLFSGLVSEPVLFIADG